MVVIKVHLPQNHNNNRPILPVSLSSRSKTLIVNPNLKNLTKIATAIHKSKRCVIITGAGISVSGGIPDFRSADGLYNLIKSKYPNVIVKGKDLFDAHVFNDPATTQVFYTFMGELKDLVSNAQVTATHHFIKNLHDNNRLLRCYTQNIDGLEARLGIPCELHDDKTSHGKSITTTSITTKRSSSSITHRSNNARIVQLHGDLDTLICTLCKSKYEFSNEEIIIFKTGQAPPCPNCVENDEKRTLQGRRPVSVGTLRPNIVLYNEHHNHGDVIADLTIHDLRKKPDLLIVMGTSLKVHGIKNLVKDVARAVHAVPNRLVVLVNRVELGKAEWDEFFDYHVEADTDDAVRVLESMMHHLEIEANKKKDSIRELSKTSNKPETTTIKRIYQKKLSSLTQSKLVIGRESPAYDQENVNFESSCSTLSSNHPVKPPPIPQSPQQRPLKFRISKPAISLSLERDGVHDCKTSVGRSKVG